MVELWIMNECAITKSRFWVSPLLKMCHYSGKELSLWKVVCFKDNKLLQQGKVIHYKCAELYSGKFNPYYVFDSSTYSGDTQVQILCHNHVTKCFGCDKIHNGANNVNVIVCERCRMACCFGLNKSVRRK